MCVSEHMHISIYNYIMSTCACMHPSTHPFIHLPIRPYMWLMWLWDLVWLNLFSKGIHQMHCSFDRPPVYTSTTVLCPWYGERSKVSNQIDTGKEEQTSTVPCSWDRLSLGKNFDRDPIILLPAEQHGTLLRIAQVRLHGKRPAYFCCAVVLGWESNLGFVSWLPNLHWPYGFDRLWVLNGSHSCSPSEQSSSTMQLTSSMKIWFAQKPTGI